MAFYGLHQKFQLNLEKCMIFGYASVLVVPVWGIIGIADQNSFGDKVKSMTYSAGYTCCLLSGPAPVGVLCSDIISVHIVLNSEPSRPAALCGNDA
jgi:hypothetical protein